MKVSATELMKQLKFIEEEIENIYRADSEKSTVTVYKDTDDKGKQIYVPMYESGYDFSANRQRIEELYDEERKIKNKLNLFNSTTNVVGYDFNVNEGLIRIAQYKREIKSLTNLSNKNEYMSISSYGRETSFSKVVYSLEDAKKALREYQRKLSALQVAIDKTNLNSTIDID